MCAIFERLSRPWRTGHEWGYISSSEIYWEQKSLADTKCYGSYWNTTTRLERIIADCRTFCNVRVDDIMLAPAVLRL